MRNPAHGNNVKLLRFGAGLMYASSVSGSGPSHAASRNTGVSMVNAAVASA